MGVAVLTNAMKSFYGDPRPFMQYSEIIVLKKSPTVGCGNPSGHSCLFYLVVSRLFEKYLLKRKLFIKSDKKPSKLRDTLLILLLAFL